MQGVKYDAIWHKGYENGEVKSSKRDTFRVWKVVLVTSIGERARAPSHTADEDGSVPLPVESEYLGEITPYFTL